MSRKILFLLIIACFITISVIGIVQGEKELSKAVMEQIRGEASISIDLSAPGNYSTWVPENGNTINITATVSPAAYIKFILTNVTNYTGSSMNAGSQTGKDLRFNGQAGFNNPPSGGQSIETSNAITSITVVVDSLDYAAYGEIYAVATQGDTGTSDIIKIPKDTNSNKIADGWSGDNLSVTTDTDSDGFINFEEYRGFHTYDNSHNRTDPNLKDFFCWSNITMFSANALGIAPAAARETAANSGLSVEVHRIADSNWEGPGPSKVVNYNETGHANHRETYAVKVMEKWYDLEHRFGLTTGAPPPSQNDYIEVFKKAISDDCGGSSSDRTTETNIIIAHEIGHAMGLVHHSNQHTSNSSPYPRICIMRTFDAYFTLSGFCSDFTDIYVNDTTGTPIWERINHRNQVQLR